MANNKCKKCKLTWTGNLEFYDPNDLEKEIQNY